MKKKYILFLLLFYFSCERRCENELKESLDLTLVNDSLFQNIILKKDTNSYLRYSENSTIQQFSAKDFYFASQYMCENGYSPACFNCYNYYRLNLTTDKEKFSSNRLYQYNILNMEYYLIKSYELKSSSFLRKVILRSVRDTSKSSNDIKNELDCFISTKH
jgi:hypothetical protein